MQKLTDRQRAVLEYISTSISDRGYPPTLREIGNHLGIRSTNGVNDHLRALERKGYLTREDMKSRTLRLVRGMGDYGDLDAEATVGAQLIELDAPRSASRVELRAESTATHPLDLASRHASSSASASASASASVASLASTRGSVAPAPIGGAVGAAVRPANDSFDDYDIVEIPIVGRVAAGALSEAIEHAEDSVRVDRMLLGRGGRDVFGLRIQGESMIDAGIHSGDFVFVRKQLEARRGDIVVALVGDEATCKYYFPERDHVRLEPANSTMSPIRIAASDWRTTQILGVVVGVYRRIES